MVYAAIGGMQLKNWLSYLKVIGPTIRVLFAAKRHPDCVYASMFKDGTVYFAISVWKEERVVKEFARGGLHARLMPLSKSEMTFFHNHTHQSPTLLSRDDMVQVWRAVIAERDGRGSVGTLVN